MLLTPLLFLTYSAIADNTAQNAERNGSIHSGYPANNEAREALRQLCRDADSGDANALYRLAYLHDIGYDSIACDTLASTRLYHLAAEKGNVAAMNYLGFRYYRGDGVEKDIAKGIDLIERAAMSGDAQAQNNLGYMLVKGEGVSHDLQRAAYWLGKAADAGVAQSQAMLADLLSDGHSLPTDTLRAASLYASASAGGIRDADYHLAALMNNKWENISADSAVNLALNLQRQRALTSAVRLLEKASAKGNARAMSLLADAYSRAAGVAYDYEKALQLFFNAAMLGDAPAAFYVAETLDIFPDLYDSLSATPNPSTTPIAPIAPIAPNSPDIFSAQYWYQRAAEAGITDAGQAADALRRPLP